jgi:hypothetical protein
MVWSWWKKITEALVVNHDDDNSSSDMSVERHETSDEDTIQAMSYDYSSAGAVQGEPTTVMAPTNNMLFVAQQETWDCGIACLLMVWSWIVTLSSSSTSSDELVRPSRAAIDKKRTDILSEIQAGTSIWTIDLVYVLDLMLEQQQYEQKEKHSAFEFDFYTQKLETNNAWSTLAYYAANFQQDQQRTERRFLALRQKGQQTKKQRLHLLKDENDSIAWIRQRIQCPFTVAILLIDRAILDKVDEENYKNNNENENDDDLITPPSSEQWHTGSYSGHYVVVIGVVVSTMVPKSNTEGSNNINHNINHNNIASDADDTQLVILDPDKGVRHVLMRHLELAWHAEGTDHDVIFVKKQPMIHSTMASRT